MNETVWSSGPMRLWTIQTLPTGHAIIVYQDREMTNVTIYGNGMLVYDHPEWVPGYVKEAMREIANQMPQVRARDHSVD